MCDQTWLTTLSAERPRGSWPAESELSTVTLIDARNEMIRGPKWRTRTSKAQRARAAWVTFLVIAGTGAVLLGGVMILLAWVGAPPWLVVAPWVVPTLVAIGWAVVRPRPAIATDDDDDSWVGYAIQHVIIGEDEPRPAPLRLLAALLSGAPVMWSLGVFGASILIGLV